uniref:MTMR6-9 GRAM domain-containing protein n=1 Tax=Sphenodon punctatus TaxID=8508 RepID=A0A8D0HJF4_SPHPU
SILQNEIQVENVRLTDRISSRKAALGTLYLTATHVIFVENVLETRKETWVLHSQISSIEKQATTATGCPLLIRCKNFQIIQFIIPQERDCHDVYISLIRLARPAIPSNSLVPALRECRTSGGE